MSALPIPDLPPSSAFDRHLTTRQAAQILNVSRRTAQNLLEGYPGVLSFSLGRKPLPPGRKPKTTLRIPLSVFERFHQQWSRPALKLKRGDRGV